MQVWTHDRFRFPLPERHRFPIGKYGLLRERLAETGVAQPEEVNEAEPVAWEWLTAVQERDLVERIRDGRLSVREVRGQAAEEIRLALRGAARLQRVEGRHASQRLRRL